MCLKCTRMKQTVISDECEIVKSAFIYKFFQICEEVKLEILKRRNKTKIIILKK